MSVSISPGLSEDATLWRYMSFTKLVALFSQKALYLSRCDQFEDPFDSALGTAQSRDSVFEIFASIGRKLGESFLKRLEEKYLNQDSEHKEASEENPDPTELGIQMNARTEAIVKDAIRNRHEEFSKHIVEYHTKHYLKEFTAGYETEFRSTFISCWYNAPHESEAMWKLYSRDTIEGVSIKTTVKQLIAALPQDKLITIRPVEYQDNYLHDPAKDEQLTRFFMKRKAFEHEKEVRVLIQDNDAGINDLPGILVPVSLNELIKEIVISPYAPDWLPDVISDTASMYGIKAPVSLSSLRGNPFHF